MTSEVAKLSLSNAPWKQRFRAQMFWNTQIAPHAPERGLVASTKTGALQWYTWDVSSGNMEQITDRPGGMATFLKLSPDGKFIYYHDDKGVGNEIGHFVRLPYHGGEPFDLTPDLPPYSSFVFTISRSGNRFGFMAAHEQGFHIYILDLDKGGKFEQRRKIFQSTQFCTGPLLSCDGSLAVVMSSEKSNKPEFNLVAFDLLTGEKLSELWDGPNTSIELREPSPLRFWFIATTNDGIETLLI
jgi:Tol biopolymer transport system component